MHEKEKIYGVCYAGLSLQTLIKHLSLPGRDLLPRLKPFIPPSFLNPRIYVSNPLQTLKSSSSQGFSSHTFVDFDIEELQSRSRRPGSTAPGLPLPFSHWSSAIAQDLLHR